MKLKTIAVTVDGKDVTVAVLDDKGLPVYVHDDAKEFGFDAPSANARIAALNAESAERRTKLGDAETRLRLFEGIEDPEAARKALETVSNLDQGALVTAGRVAEIQRAAKEAAEKQVSDAAKASQTRIAELESQVTGLGGELDKTVIGGNFSRSKFIAEKCAIPADFVEARFGDRFKREEGRVTGYYPNGDKIYSRVKAGELAEFDEAMELLVDGHPDKAHILRGSGSSGGGAESPGGGDGDRGPGKGNMGGNKSERVEALKSRFPELGKAS